MRIISKPDLRQTLIATCACFTAGLSFFLLIWTIGQIDDESGMSGLLAIFTLLSPGGVWALALARTIGRYHHVGVYPLGVFVFLSIFTAGMPGFFLLGSLLQLMPIQRTSVLLGILASLNFLMFCLYCGRRVPIGNHLLVFVLGCLSQEITILIAPKQGIDTNEYFYQTLVLSWQTLTGLGIAMSFPKPVAQEATMLTTESSDSHH